MQTKRANTPKLGAGAPANGASRASIREAARLVDEADEILGRYLKPGRWPRARTTEAFREQDVLGLVLGLYTRAMEQDPTEPAYPWNLASSLDRLGVSDLAIAYLRRAIRVADEVGDHELSGADAHLALADIAIRAGDVHIAGLAIGEARRLDPAAPAERYQRQLRRTLVAPSAGSPSDFDSARKGIAVEHLIAATCMLASDFALNVSTSLVDDEGVDLVFHRRERSTTLAVQIKSRSWAATTMRNKQRFIAQVRRSTFKPRRDLYMLFVAVDPTFADYGPVWLVPSVAFADVLANGSGDKLRFVASAAPGSDDRWVRFRHERSELPGRLLEELDLLEEPPTRVARRRRRAS